VSWWQIFRKKTKTKHGFVLALGGGGGRGLAHLGVLEVLDEHDIRPDVIVGTSIGALFGAMYALHPDALAVRNRVTEFLQSEQFNRLQIPNVAGPDAEDQSWLSRLTAAARHSMLFARAARGTSVADVNELVDMVAALLENKTFKDIQIPLHVTAVSFPCGECHIFSKGDLARSVTASMDIPGIFAPLEIDGVRYVDGGLSSELPAQEARMVAKSNQYVVAVNVGARPNSENEPTSVMGMLDWENRIKALYLRQDKKQFADVLIEPLVGFTQWHDFSNPEQEIERGRQAALDQMPKLMELLRG